MKTPNVNIKDLLKVFGFLRNNLALLVPILIAVVALLLFVPTTLLSGRLRHKIKSDSVDVARQIDSLVQEVAEAAQAEALEPYIEAYAQDANAIEDAIRQTTLRELLDYRVFADPNQTSQLVFDPFRRKYLEAVEAMLERVKAGDPPTDVEIYAALEASRATSGRGRTGMTRAGTSAGRLNVRGMSPLDRKIVEKICEDRAKTIKVYINPIDLGGYLYWSEWKFEDWDKAIRDSWYWQMAYWMLEDVLTTVEQMNKDADHVLRSPVKRVMNVQFTQTRTGRVTIGRSRRATAARDKQTPTYVTNVRNAMSATPCTGRFSSPAEDAVMDVMHFQVTVIVRAAEVMHFMQELCSAKTHKFRGWFGDQPEQTYQHNQISILESASGPVDREHFDHSSFQYGEDEVVSLDLICEYVFHVPAYAAIQPKVVADDIAGTGK
ncbi:MAG: hypothetical protein FJ280_11040 [Planctomycetes bacterium]|nr:hypothetical protein [Planctomycetota bacterium]